jgi:hypothetical protein
MAMNFSQHFQNIIRCITEAQSEGPISDDLTQSLEGFACTNTIGTLQRLVHLFEGDDSAVYLEIGVYQGQTLLSVARLCPQIPCYGIDNFSLFDPGGKNMEIVSKLMSKLSVTNAHLINMGFEEAFEDMETHLQGRRISVYLIDAAHDYRSQMMGLQLAEPYLHDRAVILIDDANYPCVRLSIRDFLTTHSTFKMIFEGYSPDHPVNMDPETLARWREGWTTGINILVKDPEGLLPDMLPATEPSRELYVNDSLIHRMALAELAPEALRLGQSICFGDPEQENREALLSRYRARKDEFKRRRRDRNVYTDGLTEGRFNLPDGRQTEVVRPPPDRSRT